MFGAGTFVPGTIVLDRKSTHKVRNILEKVFSSNSISNQGGIDHNYGWDRTEKLQYKFHFPHIKLCMNLSKTKITFLTPKTRKQKLGILKRLFTVYIVASPLNVCTHLAGHFKYILKRIRFWKKYLQIFSIVIIIKIW